MIKCKYCKVEKPESEMSIWAGKPSFVCIECKKDHPTGAGARKGNGGAAKARKKGSKAARDATALEINLPPGGFGVNARITDEGYLQLSQENEGTAADNICLTKYEAKQLFDKFGEWIVG